MPFNGVHCGGLSALIQPGGVSDLESSQRDPAGDTAAVAHRRELHIDHDVVQDVFAHHS